MGTETLVYGRMGPMRLEQDYRLDEQPKFMQKWQYMVVHLQDWPYPEEKLNDLGQQGWEVVAGAGAGEPERKSQIILVLKRPC